MPGTSPSNRLLCLVPEVFVSLRPRPELVPLRPKRILHYARVPIGQVYFIERGLISVVAVTGSHDGGGEGWLIGSEGLAGFPAGLNAPSPPYRCSVQVEGAAWAMGSADLARTMNEVPEFRQILLRYVRSMLVQVNQIAVCPLYHTVPQRLARWLLLAHDRLGTARMALIQDAIPRMLGIERGLVKEALHQLEQIGAVSCGRLEITVLERPKLERLVCSCYGTLKAEFDQDLRAAHDPSAPSH